MLAAQLHHKVSLQVEDMEDVLTTSVFALLRYLPGYVASYLLARWADVPLRPDPPQVDFWPQYPTPSGFGISLETADARAEARIRGETEVEYVITYYGRPIAVLLPIDETCLGDVARRVAEATSPGHEAAAELEKLRQEIDQSWKSDRTGVDLLRRCEK